MHDLQCAKSALANQHGQSRTVGETLRQRWRPADDRARISPAPLRSALSLSSRRLFELWRSPAMELASVVHSAVVRSGRAAVSAARSLEVAGQLRAAIMESDDAGIAR